MDISYFYIVHIQYPFSGNDIFIILGNHFFSFSIHELGVELSLLQSLGLQGSLALTLANHCTVSPGQIDWCRDGLTMLTDLRKFNPRTCLDFGEGRALSALGLLAGRLIQGQSCKGPES